ncbi:putative monoamine oxidase sheepish [Anticarsia gemmatalis]|uniref:putative monoamine oxidase sheepish n=1 Tax=Anticarsia gemmatalis TaxID=129554 RepID=UPI003F76300D
MVKKHHKGSKTSVKADVIILGCSLPGIVTANKLKKKFGDTMDIVVLDLVGTSSKSGSRCGVAFKDVISMATLEDEEEDDEARPESSAKKQVEAAAKKYLIKYANELGVPIPSAIVNPREHNSTLNKLFEYRNGSTVRCTNNFNDFAYLNFVEKFELNQYQTFLDGSMKRLFQTNGFDEPSERNRLMYYDRTTMEQNICDALLFPTSREIMRTTVKLVCGAPADTVSLLFYLHQCFRTSGTRHHIDGENTRFREKIMGSCRKRILGQLLASIADIVVTTKSIKQIRTHTGSNAEQVILETMKGDTTYICKLLAMALKPDQLKSIKVDNQLLPETEAEITHSLIPGKAKRFIIQYENNFWESQGFSGDILSMRGPIIWAMQRPRLSFTGSKEKYASLIGYLMVRDDEDSMMENSKDAVVEQLTNLFGWEAQSPVVYRETSMDDIFVPRCGDYVGLRVLTNGVSPRGLEWGAFDIFADGDVAAALEAGHTAYLHVVSILRPQAQTFEDISDSDWPTVLMENPFSWWMSHLNVLSTIKLSVYAAAIGVGIKLLRTYLRR